MKCGFYKGLVILLTCLVCLSCEPARQMPDLSFDTKVVRPAYTNERPKVLFDEAHKNIHTSETGYKPFAKLITSDGYLVVPNSESFSLKSLEGHRILLIANAVGANDANDDSAFTDDECDAVRDWVRSGGSLLFITDHAPTGSAAEQLAKRFDVEMSKGMTEDPGNHDTASGDSSQLVFSRENRLLLDHPITNGRDESEKVHRVVTFTGQSLKAPETGTPFLKLGDSAQDRPAKLEVEKSGSDTLVNITYGEPTPAKGFAQGIAFQFGEGRVVILAEAAMLTAQLDGKTKQPFGMNVQGVDNRQLALNIMHWLSGII